MQTKLFDGRISICVGDITRQAVDAVVNAANSSLFGGGGVDGAIHRAGGSQILEECRRIRRDDYPKGLPTGKAVITTGGDLPARFIIHTVGPVYGENDGRDAELLADCYTNSLAIAASENLSSVAFPAISTGVYRYPKSLAAKIASRAVKEFLQKNQTLDDVRFVFINEADAAKFMKHRDF